MKREIEIPGGSNIECSLQGGDPGRTEEETLASAIREEELTRTPSREHVISSRQELHGPLRLRVDVGVRVDVCAYASNLDWPAVSHK